MTDAKVSASTTRITSLADTAKLHVVQGGNPLREYTTWVDIKSSLLGGNEGTAATNVTAVEYGDGGNFVTKLTLAAVELTPTIPANAEGAGGLIYTFPSGVYVAHSCHMDITSGVMDSATNAADLGVGSVIASGDVSVLGGTAGFEDWMTGQTIADVSTFSAEKSTLMTAGGSTVFESGDSHALYINVAGTWDATVATASITGTVTIAWTFLGS